eukprot:CAMPEP_0169443920 /NCGR_PEP_ID=MMETSP1042-20121227/9624_1 /TAXON_ID=464988 /ORGANISM="Hemiselmis andersenii, Strain CCMP1180" /LENGTH=128 /DNA_ID=CAMNT_0009555203 /DNA_START=299 /DNA_END=682 /DNA_ORIENTATION=-
MACVPAPLSRALGKLFGRGGSTPDMTPMPVQRPFLTVDEIRERDMQNQGPHGGQGAAQQRAQPATRMLDDLENNDGGDEEDDEVRTSAWDGPAVEETKGICPWCNFVVTKGQERIKIVGGESDGKYAH